MKTKGDKVREMSNEELVRWGIKYFRTDWDYASSVMSQLELVESAVAMLNEPAEQTADEMFEEMGWSTVSGNVYQDKYGLRMFEVLIDDIVFWTEQPAIVFAEKELFQIRKVAETKRKEVWK